MTTATKHLFEDLKAHSPQAIKAAFTLTALQDQCLRNGPVPSTKHRVERQTCRKMQKRGLLVQVWNGTFTYKLTAKGRVLRDALDHLISRGHLPSNKKRRV